MDLAGCSACELLRGSRRVPGGILWQPRGFALHALDGPCPLPGWLVLTATQHRRALYDLDPEEAAALGTLAREVMRAQRAALGAEHVYAFAIGDALPHFHLHLVPRFAATPSRLRGRGCFEGRPEDALPEDALADAAAKVARMIAGAAAP